jgi:hypothetical protein
MSSKPRRNETKKIHAIPSQEARRERLRQGVRRVTKKSDVAHTKSISNAAYNQAVSWTIGSRPNANLKVGCFRTRRRAREHAWIEDKR